MREFIENTTILIGIVLFLVFACASVIAPMAYMDSVSCTNYGERTNQQIDWSITNGCMVLRNGTWSPSKNSIEVIKNAN